MVLSRKPNESIRIADNITVIVLEVRDGQVKIGVEAPSEISIHRSETYDAILARDGCVMPGGRLGGRYGRGADADGSRGDYGYPAGMGGSDIDGNGDVS